MGASEETTPTHQAVAAVHQLSTSILDGWKEHLCAVGLELQFEHETGVLGLRAHLPISYLGRTLTLDIFQRACEGIALLNILLCLDVSLWRTTMTAIFESVTPNRGKLGLSVSAHTSDVLEWISERVVGVDEASREYTESIAVIDHALLPSVEDRIPVRVVFLASDLTKETYHCGLRHFLQIARTQQALPEPNSVADARERTRVTLVGCGVDALRDHHGFSRARVSSADR